MKLIVSASLVLICSFCSSQSISLPPEFENVTLISGLKDPSSLAFSPDGRMFYTERITGKLRVAEYNSISKAWEKLPHPFYTFDVPVSQHRSSGLRGITFDPQFNSNGYVYAYYMKDNPRHNRVVRIQADPTNSDVALAGETLLLDVPFNSSSSSGSHNGGDLVFGADGKLYFTTGDGWNGGDNVQSLTTFTGKLFRINADGSIPSDNPFYNETTGDYRAIYTLGLRNPYTVSSAAETQNIYINDAVGSSKATVYQVLNDGSSARANFGHDGFNGIGTLTSAWGNTGVGGSKLITGGAWYPQSGYWPNEYKGSYFAAMWGSNSISAGHIVQVVSESNTSKSIFASGILIPPRHKPVMTEIGPDGNLYYMLTDYETGDGQVHMIRYTGQEVAAAPDFDPQPGQYDLPIKVHLSSSTLNDSIYYTLDGSNPDSTSILFIDSVVINSSMEIRAIAYADSVLPSSISIGNYIIGAVPNLSPVADAGPDLIVKVGSIATLNGSGSYDPDGSPLEIRESWVQVDGPETALLDEDETVANFTPMHSGSYTFRIYVEDVEGIIDSADAKITAVKKLPDFTEGLIARWSCEEGINVLVEDTSPNSNQGELQGGTWTSDTGDGSTFSTFLSGSDQRVDIGNLDISGSELSICFWTKIQSFSTHDARFISKANGQNDVNHMWMVSMLNGSKLRFRLNTSSGGTTTLISDEDELNLNEWMHISVTYDGSNMKMYKNGLLLKSTAKTGSIGTDPTMKAALGNQPANVSGGDRPLDGWLDEVRIYGIALTPLQIDSVRGAALEICNKIVTNFNDDGNGSLRRAINCAQTNDTLTFGNAIDSIKIISSSIDVNNNVSIVGNSNFYPIVNTLLSNVGINVGMNVTVNMKNLNIFTQKSPALNNAGTLNLEDVSITIPSGSTFPAIQNTGQAVIKGEVVVKKE